MKTTKKSIIAVTGGGALLASSLLASILSDVNVIETLQPMEAQAATNQFVPASTATKALRYKARQLTTIQKSTDHSSKRIATLPKGAFVKITGHQNVNNVNYAKVNYNGKIGFVVASTIAVKKPSQITHLSKKAAMKKAATMRNTYGTDWTTHTVAKVAAKKAVTVKKYVTFNSIRYAQITVSGKTGYVNASLVTETKSTTTAYPTTTPSGLKVQRDVSDTDTYVSRDDAYKDPSTREHLAYTNRTVFTIIGYVTYNDSVYVQIDVMGRIGYLDYATLNKETFKLKPLARDYNRVPESLLDRKFLAVVDTPVKASYDNPSDKTIVTLKRGTAVKVIGYHTYDTPFSKGVTYSNLIKFTQNGKTYEGYVSGSAIQYQSTIELDDTSDIDGVSTPSEVTPSEPDVEEPKTEDEAPVDASSLDTYINDKRQMVLAKSTPIYKNVPTSKTSPAYNTVQNETGAVIKLSAPKSSKIGNVIKVAFGSSKHGVRTGYVKTSRVYKYNGNLALNSINNMSHTLTRVKPDVEGKVVGSKEGYDALADLNQLTMYMPVAMSSDGKVVSSNGIAGFFSKMGADSPDYRDLVWDDVKNNTAKDPWGTIITPTTMEDVIKKYKKTKNYIIDTQDTNAVPYTTDIHKAVANLINKYGLENNVFMYISDSKTETAKSIAAEIKAINPKINVVHVLTKKQQKAFSVTKFNDSNINGLAFNGENYTKEIVKTMKANNLQIHLHREIRNDPYLTAKIDALPLTDVTAGTSYSWSSDYYNHFKFE